MREAVRRRAIDAFQAATALACFLHVPDLAARFSKEDRGGGWRLPENPAPTGAVREGGMWREGTCGIAAARLSTEAVTRRSGEWANPGRGRSGGQYGARMTVLVRRRHIDFGRIHSTGCPVIV
ncbi:hypothetical protein AMK13_16680 [Streptomyces sp. CB02056]|nr:hypothetical protein AMK13_16680 [Streptomyces sp. CB02056]